VVAAAVTLRILIVWENMVAMSLRRVLNLLYCGRNCNCGPQFKTMAKTLRTKRKNLKIKLGCYLLNLSNVASNLWYNEAQNSH
jgi:hypothetical protein